MEESRDLEWFPQIRKFYLRNAVIRLLLPLILIVSYFLGSYLILPSERALILGGLMIAYYIPPTGKESIIPVGIILGIPWWLMAITVVVQDVITCLFMILNLDIAFHIPYLGPWIYRFLAKGKEYIAKWPWLSRWKMWGLAFFVLLPFQGTGGTGAPLVGWMMGLTPGRILFAVGLGASLEALFFALGSELVWVLVFSNFTLALVALAILLFVVFLAYYLFQFRSGRERL
ncbi:MAG: small multi-drug export protein [Methanomicrobiales archaeon]|nr:small multi-drug export protein [Methanomicrobiales archaeon]